MYSRTDDRMCYVATYVQDGPRNITHSAIGTTVYSFFPSLTMIKLDLLIKPS